MATKDNKQARKKADESSEKFTLGKKEDASQKLKLAAKTLGKRCFYSLGGLNGLTKLPRVPADPSKKEAEKNWILRHYQSRDYITDKGSRAGLGQLEDEKEIEVVIVLEGKAQVWYCRNLTETQYPADDHKIDLDGALSSDVIDLSGTEILYTSQKGAIKSAGKVAGKAASKPAQPTVAKQAPVQVSSQPAAPANSQASIPVAPATPIVNGNNDDEEEAPSNVTDNGVCVLPVCTESDWADKFEFYLKAGFRFEAYKIALRASVLINQLNKAGSLNLEKILGKKGATFNWEKKRWAIIEDFREYAFKAEGVLDEYESPNLPQGFVPALFDAMVAQEGRCPRFLLTGPPGVGKTSWILCLPYFLGNPKGLVVIQCDANLNFSGLIGGTAVQDGDTVFGEASLAAAAQRVKNGEYGIIVYWQEVLNLPKGILKACNNYFTQRMIDWAGRGNSIHIRVDNGITLWDFLDFNPISGKNLDGDVTNSQRDRFFELTLPFFTEAQIKKILLEKEQVFAGLRYKPTKKLSEVIARYVISMRSLVFSRGSQLNAPALRIATEMLDLILTNPAVTPRQVFALVFEPFIFEKTRLESSWQKIIEEFGEQWKQILPVGQSGSSSDLDRPFSEFISEIIELSEA